MKNIDLGSAYHENKWALSIQTPVTGMDGLLDAMRTQLAQRQVHSTRCLHITGPGKQQFRVRDGSRSGAQEAVQSLPVGEIGIPISMDQHILRKTFEVILEQHVHENPTILVTECWATRSRYTCDPANPNKYWNRADADELHGTAQAQAKKTS